MKIFFALILCVPALVTQSFSQSTSLGATIQISNPINDTKVGWFNIDSESIDRHNVKNQSLALGILIDYFNDINWRLRIQYTQIDLREYRNTEFITTNTTGKQQIIDFAPGISWNISTQNQKLFPYFGFEIPVSLKGQYQFKNDEIYFDGVSTEILSSSERKIDIPSGYSLGIGGLLGFKYFILSNLSVSGEFSSGLIYSKLGGIIKEESKFEDFLVGEFFSENSTFEDRTEGITFSENRFSFGIGFQF